MRLEKHPSGHVEQMRHTLAPKLFGGAAGPLGEPLVAIGDPGVTVGNDKATVCLIDQKQRVLR